MIIDINAYIGKWPYWPVRASSASEVAGELQDWKIDAAAICSTRSIFVNCADGNRETALAAAQHPGRFFPFACLGPGDELPLGTFCGVRLYPQHHSYHPLYEPEADRIIAYAAGCRWPVLLPLRLIMNWGMPMMDLAVINALVERHPKAIWILAGINYLHELQLAVSLMRRFETVHLETSCIMGYDAIAKTVHQCGAGQLMFGSGAPIQHGSAGVSKIMHAKISDDAREAILCGNAKRLLGINNE